MSCPVSTVMKAFRFIKGFLYRRAPLGNGLEMIVILLHLIPVFYTRTGDHPRRQRTGCRFQCP